MTNEVIDPGFSSSLEESASTISDRIAHIHGCLNDGRLESIVELIGQWPASEIANTLEALPLAERHHLWQLVLEEQKGEVLARLGDQVRIELLQSLEVGDAVAATAGMVTPDLAEVVGEASAELREAILESLDPDDLILVEDTLTYPEDSAGRLMERELVAIRADVGLDVVKRYLHQRGSLPRRTTALMVVDREGHFMGKLPLELLLTKDPEMQVAELMDTSAVSVNVLTPLSEVANLFHRRDLVALPVIDDNHKLVGRIFQPSRTIIRCPCTAECEPQRWLFARSGRCTGNTYVALRGG